MYKFHNFVSPMKQEGFDGSNRFIQTATQVGSKGFTLKSLQLTPKRIARIRYEFAAKVVLCPNARASDRAI